MGIIISELVQYAEYATTHVGLARQIHQLDALPATLQHNLELPMEPDVPVRLAIMIIIHKFVQYVMLPALLAMDLPDMIA